MNNLERAKKLLSDMDYTCVICSDTDTRTSKQRGVAPLLSWLDHGENLCNYSAADKVVGNGAAFLYVLMNIKEVHANVISRAAYKTLLNNNITVTYTTLTEAIRNRDNTGICPIETVVSEITDAQEALAAIRTKLAEIKNEKR